MQKINFYIVVHSIGIINFFEETKKYEKLSNYKYLLVGTPDKDYSTDKIIQCNRLRDNIEHNNNYLAYTGWYALANNFKSIDSEYVCLLEYDTDIMPEFDLDRFTNAVVNKSLNCCGLTYMPLHDGIFVNTQFTYKTLEYLREKNIKEIKPTNTNWMTTNNMIFKTEFFYQYFKDPFIQEFLTYLNNDAMSGHFLERILSIYCFLQGIKFDIVEDSGLKHRGLDSHETQNIYNSNRGYEQFKTVNKISD
jgi:hypothetical protein